MSSPSRSQLKFRFRGREREIDAFAPRTTLLDWLREQEGAKGTKEGCGEGDCGACTVVLAQPREGRVAYSAVNACILLLGQIDGAELLTIEDLGAAEALHPVQQAMVDLHGSQCGFCTPGFVMSLFALYHSHDPAAGPLDRAEIDQALAGNLCRCTGYRPIVAAAARACSGQPVDTFSVAQDSVRLQLAAMRASDVVGARRKIGAMPAASKPPSTASTWPFT